VKRQQAAVAACCRRFFELLARRDPAVLGLLSTRVIKVGSGRDDVGIGHEQVSVMILRHFAQLSTPMELTERRLHVECLSAATAQALFEYTVRTEIDTVPLVLEGMRGTLVFHREAKAWRITYIHLSMPDPILADGEGLPIRAMEKSLHLLEGMIQGRTRKLEDANRELAETNRFLLEAMDESRALRGLLPVCAGCKKIRVNQDYWETMEEYLERRTTLKFTHGLCPECDDRFFSPEAEDSLRSVPATGLWRNGKIPL
jgi:hypothetical protein